jgi:hypothetical protein
LHNNNELGRRHEWAEHNGGEVHLRGPSEPIRPDGGGPPPEWLAEMPYLRAVGLSELSSLSAGAASKFAQKRERPASLGHIIRC